MLIFIVIVLSIAFYLYAILGGADFGAGVMELFTGKRSIKPIYKAIAPVWEANHMWIILAVVIVFNGFPPIYAEMSTSLHIPLFVILIGIIMRGTAFTFRHYDTHEDETHKYYHFFFRFSSVLTSVFLGIVLGAMMLGRMTLSPEADFLEKYIHPWFNIFCGMMGVFTASLFAYIASAYIIGEVKTEEERVYFSRITRRFAVATILLGAIVLLLGKYHEAPFMYEFFNNPMSISAFVLATILIPFIFIQIRRKHSMLLRMLVAAQVGVIMLGWTVIQWPNVIYIQGGEHFTLYNSAAGEATLFYLTIALVIGSIIIFPALFYLFRLFKSRS